MFEHAIVSRCGKQLMLRGKHLADARDERVAQALELFLNNAMLVLTDEETERAITEGLRG